MSEIKLKSCPFCGNKPYIGYNATRKHYKIFCNCCGLAIIPQYPHVKDYPNFKDVEETIDVWNARKPVEKALERLEELYNDIEIQYENNYENGLANGYNKAIEIIKEEVGA